MDIGEMEAVIRRHRVTMQDVLSAALTLEEISTIGGSSSMGYGGGGGDPAHLLDMALSVTKHIHEGERERLAQWTKTDHIEPHRWSRAALAFWRRVPFEAAADMARVAPGII